MTEFAQIFVDIPRILGWGREKSPSNFEGVILRSKIGVVYILFHCSNVATLILRSKIGVVYIICLFSNIYTFKSIFQMYNNSNSKKSSFFLLNFLYKLPRRLKATPLQILKGIFWIPLITSLWGIMIMN